MLVISACGATPPTTKPNMSSAMDTSNTNSFVDVRYDPTFPSYPFYLGRCWDGVQNLGPYYENLGFEVKYAYRDNDNDGGHVWLLVDNEPIDYYYGRVDDNPSSYWMNPEQTYDNIDEFREHVIDATRVKL